MWVFFSGPTLLVSRKGRRVSWLPFPPSFVFFVRGILSYFLFTCTFSLFPHFPPFLFYLSLSLFSFSPSNHPTNICFDTFILINIYFSSFCVFFFKKNPCYVCYPAGNVILIWGFHVCDDEIPPPYQFFLNVGPSPPFPPLTNDVRLVRFSPSLPGISFARYPSREFTQEMFNKAPKEIKIYIYYLWKSVGVVYCGAFERGLHTQTMGDGWGDEGAQG